MASYRQARAVNRYRESQKSKGNNLTLTDNDLARIRYHGASIPFVGDALKLYDSDRRMSDYLSNRGLEWSDMLYPSLVSGSGAGYGITNKVEKSLSAIAKLYLRYGLSAASRLA